VASAARLDPINDVVMLRLWQGTHLITADDVKVAEVLGALLEQEFLAQNLPKFTPEPETASELISEAV
jgi:hypothetical protein